MRFSKKLLTVLLPITAASTLVPVLTSCSQPKAWDFSYGDEINCLHQTPEEGEGTYHSLSDIKNAVKNHVSIEPQHTISGVSVLPQWDIDFGKQFLYYDLIASCAFATESTLFKTPLSFSVKWDLTQDVNKIWFCATPLYGEETWTKVEQIQYITRSGSTNVFIGIGSLFVKSYCFQNVTIEE